MPQLSDVIEKREKKKFTRRSYRPWDLSGDGQNSSSNTATPVKETVTEIQPQAHAAASETKKQETAQAITQTVLDNITGNKKTTNKETIKKPIENKQITDRIHIDNSQATTRIQKANLLDNNTDNNLSVDFYVEAIRKLTGIQEKIFHHVVELCLVREELDTGHLLTTDLAMVANCSIGSAKTSLERLIQKKLLIRKKGKCSRGGHLFLSITKEIQIATTHAKKYLRHLSSMDNAIANNIANNHHSISSNNYINNITTTVALPVEWQEIDYTALADIGFSVTQLTQLYSKRLNVPEVVQESINHFAYGLEHNPKFKTYQDPLNVLMGVLRKGGAWFEKNYISPKEKALEELLKLKKQEAERLQAMEKNILDEEYKIWVTNLPESERTKITESVPKNKSLPQGVLDRAIEGYLLQYFKDNVYEKN